MEKVEAMSQGVSDFALGVCGWIEDQADVDELRSFVAEWRGVPIGAVTIEGDCIEIAAAEPVTYPTPKEALALIASLQGLFAQIMGPVMVHGNGCGRYGTKIGLSQEEFEALRTQRIDAAREALRSVGAEV